MSKELCIEPADGRCGQGEAVGRDGMSNGSQQPLEVVRIIRRSAQGVTLPFLCEVSDGRLFWAKGNLAGKRALCCEWLAGSLARAVGLPIPPFAQLSVSDELIAQSLIDSAADLGSGLVFGSHDIGDAQELGIEDARRVMRQDPETAVLTLAFDWWIQNGDRILGDRGGNPNILISMSDQRMHIIDHNVAFDDSWHALRFFEDHVFAAIRKEIGPPKLLALRDRLRQVRGHVDSFWAEIPDSWRFLDRDGTLRVELTMDRVYTVLDRLETEWEEVWK